MEPNTLLGGVAQQLPSVALCRGDHERSTMPLNRQGYGGTSYERKRGDISQQGPIIVENMLGRFTRRAFSYTMPVIQKSICYYRWTDARVCMVLACGWSRFWRSFVSVSSTVRIFHVHHKHRGVASYVVRRCSVGFVTNASSVSS